MPQPAPPKQEEILITRGATDAAARAIQRRAKEGELTALAEGIYSRENEPQAQAAIVRRNWTRILGSLVPDAVVSYRSSFAGGITPNNSLFLSHPTRYNKTIKLPGLNVHLVQGPTALPGDMPHGSDGLHFASRPRQLLENLSRSRGPNPRAAGEEAVEQKLVKILNASGEAELNRIRDAAGDLAKPLGFEKEYLKLDGLIGALLATRADGKLKTKEGKLVAKGTPIDRERIELFEILASKLRTDPIPRRKAVATEEPARSNFASVESYFSNFVEGTEFAIEEAMDITLKGRVFENRLKDSHDVLGVFTLAQIAAQALVQEVDEHLARRGAQPVAQRVDYRATHAMTGMLLERRGDGAQPLTVGDAVVVGEHEIASARCRGSAVARRGRSAVLGFDQSHVDRIHVAGDDLARRRCAAVVHDQHFEALARHRLLRHRAHAPLQRLGAMIGRHDHAELRRAFRLLGRAHAAPGREP